MFYLFACTPSSSDHPFACLLHVYVFFPSINCSNPISQQKKNQNGELEPYQKFWPQDRVPNQPSTIHCEAPHPVTSAKIHSNPKIKLNGEKLSKENISKPTKTKSESKSSHLHSNGKGVKNDKNQVPKSNSLASLASSEGSLNEYDVETATTPNCSVLDEPDPKEQQRSNIQNQSVVTQPVVSESTSTFTTITTTESSGMDPTSPEKCITKKTSTTSEQKTIQQVSKSTKIITCPIEDLQSAIVKTESVMYNPNSKPCSPQSTTYVPVVETETCKVFYTTDLPQSPGNRSFSRSSNASPSPLPLDTSLLGEDILNTSSVSSKTRTVETITYKTEKDGVIETRVEKKITIHSDGDPIDHDQALAEAIHEATLMNPNLTVEKIEIQQQPPKQ
ncbi:protein 4.1 homolog [Trichonephila inaurata madagascariensis]|uniref:Protein 4.1 homolog n=1 Tax=Trichonephila inaurata madagascariensis TaxID=2747483 RepID=A0A8X6MHA5_9ARAC|nr:protein 4.1 homolog [Trichonephila inaurata madagascariensis]